MSLIHFKYLRRQRIATLIVILTLTSTLFSVTVYSFLGFYNGLTNYVGEGKDIVAVYSKIGSTPFTGIIPMSVINQIAQLDGVQATSPEVVSPCTINEQSVFLRGVLPQELSKLNPIIMIQGNNLNINDTNATIIGKNLAQRLNLKTGDAILVMSVLTRGYATLEIKGAFETRSSLDDEAIVPLYIGQWLRGLNYNEVTMIRAKINLNQTSANQLYNEIATKTNVTSSPTTSPTTSPSPTPESEVQRELEALIPLAQSNLNFSNVGVQESQQFMTNYLQRYGISRDSLIILSILVLIIASGTATCAITLFIKQHSSDIESIHSIGLSTKKIKIDIALRMLLWALIATVISTIISAIVLTIFQQTGYLQVLSHTITFQLDPLVIVANFALLALLIGVNIARQEFKE
jgi:ABC-type lipoprotein release transport system permease subunit